MRTPHLYTVEQCLGLVRRLSLLLCLSGCATYEPVDLSPTSLQATLTGLAQRHHVCGVAVAVIKNRTLDSVDSANGCLPNSTLHADSVFQAASLSKPVFAYAVLKLVEQGRLGLDVPIMKYLPQGYRHQPDPLNAAFSAIATDPGLQAITVRMVLNHTSGLPNWASGPLHVKSIPGATWQYSGEGYVLLQRAVEAVTGQPLDQFMALHVFKPLGMKHSAFAWNENVAGRLMPGTKANGTRRRTLDLKNPNAAFSLFTTAQDYGKFVATSLSDDIVMQQITASPVAVDPALGLSWGLGWGIARIRDEAYIWQWGNNSGYRAFVIASVRTGDGFVMLTNSENGLKLAEPLTQKLLPNEHKVFKSSILGGDTLVALCNTVRLCL